MAKAISRILFDLLAIGTRRAVTRFVAKELSWWSDLDEGLIGTVTLDYTDNDYGWVLLAKDGTGRYRAIDVMTSLSSERLATAQLRAAIEEKARSKDFNGFEMQDDEPIRSVNLFEDRKVPDAKLHEYYKQLRDLPVRQPARKVFEAIAPWLLSSDPHLVKEFQESQFDQRLWEIYLWAVLRDQGFDVTHQEAPDLKVETPWYSFFIEATTVAPSQGGPLAKHPNPKTPQEINDFNNSYMPMKFGSALVSKLNKRDAKGLHYWEKEEVKGKPFLLAVADFHKPADEKELASLTYSQCALTNYLYGISYFVEVIDGRPTAKCVKVLEHNYNGKTIPSGFFSLPEAENISAILFSNAGTIAKFDRMGVLAGYGYPGHKFVRIGQLYDPTPGALVGIPFSIDIADPEYFEGWADELLVFHNPRALHALPIEAFPHASQFFFENGELLSTNREGAVLGSFTLVLTPRGSTSSTPPRRA